MKASISRFSFIIALTAFGLTLPVAGYETFAEPVLLVIYDGSDLGGYDAYRDVNFADGSMRAKVVERTQPTYAIDAESMDDALDAIEAMGIAPESLDRIAIVDHGDVEKDPPIQTLGNDALRPRDFRSLRYLLKREGDLCLYGCEVGKNVRYLKRISSHLKGRRVWAYAGLLSYDHDNPPPLPDPDRSMFFYYPML